MAKCKKLRLDRLLVLRGIAMDIKEAKAFVMTGTVIVDEQRIEKAGQLVSENANIRIKGHQKKDYVSRGGLKLAHGLDYFQINPNGLICLDIGVSTGGFTDCLLQRGAKRVYAVDVGYGQLAWKLRNDHRVTVLERTHACHLTREHVPDDVDILVADVSFISLTKILPVVVNFLAKTAQIILLVKPQFEAQREDVETGGIVRNPMVHKQVCDRIKGSVSALGFKPQGIIESPILGAQGNLEFLLYAIRE